MVCCCELSEKLQMAADSACNFLAMLQFIYICISITTSRCKSIPIQLFSSSKININIFLLYKEEKNNNHLFLLYN